MRELSKTNAQSFIQPFFIKFLKQYQSSIVIGKPNFCANCSYSKMIFLMELQYI